MPRRSSTTVFLYRDRGICTRLHHTTRGDLSWMQCNVDVRDDVTVEVIGQRDVNSIINACVHGTSTWDSENAMSYFWLMVFTFQRCGW